MRFLQPVFYLSTRSICLFFITICACQSMDPHNEQNSLFPSRQQPKRVAQKYNPPMARALTFIGQNGQARFSPDGHFILYISRNRESHKNSQVYEMDFSTKKERRFTFHHGENRDPSYHPNGQKIIYASSTDELKERPKFVREALGQLKKDLGRDRRPSFSPLNFSPYEIYTSNRDGSDIRRLTHSPNFDAEARYHPTGEFLTFSTVRTGHLMIFKMTPNGRKQEPWSRHQHLDNEAYFSRDGQKLAWVRYSEAPSESQIYISSADRPKVTQPLTTKKAHHWSPVWHPDNQHIVFSSNRDPTGDFELYVMKSDGSCINRLTYSLGDDQDPDISPDGTKLLFTSRRNGTEQVYIIDFILPTTCPESIH